MREWGWLSCVLVDKVHLGDFLLELPEALVDGQHVVKDR
jgi:hypothetical protein